MQINLFVSNLKKHTHKKKKKKKKKKKNTHTHTNDGRVGFIGHW